VGIDRSAASVMQVQGSVEAVAFLPNKCRAFMAGPLMANAPDNEGGFKIVLRAVMATEQDARDVLLESALRLYDALGVTIDGLREESA
jgi:hypothetical protein